MSQEDTDEDEDKELNEQQPSETEQQISLSVHSQNFQPKSPSKNRGEKSDRIMCNPFKNSEKDVFANDEDAHNLDFFKSLLPLIRGWTNLAMIEFRTDLLGLIKRYNETQNC